MEQLKQAILESIGEIYKKCYIGPLKITKFKSGGYDVAIGLDCEEKPIHIAAQLEWNDFLKYFKQEIRKARLSDSHFYTGYKRYGNYIQLPVDHRDSIKVVEQ